MIPSILVVNAGSSSIKFSVFTPGDASFLTRVYAGGIFGIGGAHAYCVVKAADNTQLVKQDLAATAGHEDSFATLLDWLNQRQDGLEIAVVGHRIVHGGGVFRQPVRIDAAVLAQLEQLIPLAPLHQPHNVALVKILQKLQPQLPQIACFDNAFHSTLPKVACDFALPRDLTATGIRRYGFHGLSYEYIALTLPTVVGYLPARVIVAHLGNGVSLCALKHGRSVATTMGFTPLDGVPMGTRPGAVDPGVLLHLLKHGMDVDTLHDMLYYRSGLLGVSGISNDMQELLASSAPAAAEAIDVFVYRISREIGSLAAALGGLDALVFTAGIGQYAVPIRARICQESAWLGIDFDSVANAHHGPRLSTASSRVSAWVIATDEEYIIARHSYAQSLQPS